MQNFNLRAIADFTPVDATDVLKFEAHGARRVKFTVNANDRVSVFLSYDEEMTDPKLVASADGLFNVEFSVMQTVYVQVVAPEGTAIMVNGFAKTQRVNTVERESYTKIEPRQRSNDQFDRMMLLMQHNERVRNEQLEMQMRNIELQYQKRISALSAPQEGETNGQGGKPHETPKDASSTPPSAAQDDPAADPASDKSGAA